MLVYGIDFTCSPSSNRSGAKNAKWLPLARGELKAGRLTINGLETLNSESAGDFKNLTQLLTSTGPWIMGIDVPLGMPLSCVTQFQWLEDRKPKPIAKCSSKPATRVPSEGQEQRLPWERYIQAVQKYANRKAFRNAIESWKERGIDGQPRQVRRLRVIDQKMKGASPMNCVRPAVGLMFFEACRLLQASPVSIWPMRPKRNEQREVLEVYPRLVANWVVGSKPYKDATNTSSVRGEILDAICQSRTSSAIRKRYGLSVKLSPSDYQACLDDQSGDKLDAVLCALQAAYAFKQSDRTTAIPRDADRKSIVEIEGWVCDPSIV